MATKKKSIESLFSELEAIVDTLGQEETVPLEESLALYEKGVKLVHSCQEILARAEQKITWLSQMDKEQDEGT